MVTVTDEEKGALAGLWVSIGEDTNGDGEIDVMWGTIEVLPLPLPFPDPYPLSPGVYNVVVLVVGIAGYPEVETPIGFTIEGTCEAIPITLP